MLAQYMRSGVQLPCVSCSSGNGPRECRYIKAEAQYMRSGAQPSSNPFSLKGVSCAMNLLGNSRGYHDVPPTTLPRLIVSLDSGDIAAELGNALASYDEALELRGSAETWTGAS